jgi:triosephosphate isomerase
MRKPFVAANWKMNLCIEKIEKFMDIFYAKTAGLKKTEIEVAICAPYVYLSRVCQKLREKNKEHSMDIQLGAQNMHWKNEGAYTGEISGPMLVDMGCRYVILGHSERRAMFGETDEKVSEKAKAAFANGLLPIICVGETLEQREQNKTLQVVETQLKGSLAGLAPAQIGASTIAYEPVWAIGTGRTAKPEMAQEVQKMIRGYISTHYGDTIGKTLCIQYGGSVKPENMQELMVQPDIDGALVGGASLMPDSFAEIVKIVACTGQRK